MKLTIFILLFSLPVVLYGQTNATVKKIFYDLPLDASRETIKKKLLSDKRFVSNEHLPDTAFNIYEDTFLGMCNTNGVVRKAPDSTEVELTFGFSFSPGKKKGRNKSSNDLLLKLRYYYSVKDSAECEYDHLLAVLRPLTNDTGFTRIDTIYSDSPVRSKFKARGMEFVFHNPYYKVTVLSANITEHYYGLFLEYTRKEKQ
jgi:hypothetical protein